MEIGYNMKKIVNPKHPHGWAGAEFTVTCMSIKPSGFLVSNREINVPSL